MPTGGPANVVTSSGSLSTTPWIAPPISELSVTVTLLLDALERLPAASIT